jgi:predicted acyl esterase
MEAKMVKQKKDWHELISQPVYSEMKTEEDVFIPMRDGVRLSADIYRPDATGKFPALVAFQAFGKNHERMGLNYPPQARPSHLWDGTFESGDTKYLVARGYAHVNVDARGTGDSDGEFYGAMGSGRGGEGKDIYDVIEWLAQQPWCSGNIGMLGLSYLGCMQILAAAEQPPHLKCICPEGGHFDMYEMTYQGGIMWLMLRAAFEGRGGDSPWIVNNFQSFMMKTLPKEEFERRVQERLMDPDIKYYPNLHSILCYPKGHELFLDLLLNPYDGPFYQKAKAAARFEKIKIPVHFGVQWGRGWTVDGHIDGYLKVKGPKKLVLRAPPPMQERPFHQFHDDVVRWSDHWLKGIDTGVMDEPPIKIFVQGVNEWHYEHEWPLARTKWTKFYLRPRHKLSIEPEPLDTDAVPPDGFYQPPLHVTHKTSSVSYRTPAFLEDTEITGWCALYIYASIDTDDTNWIVRIFDVDPHGGKVQLTTGWLKASHREVDEAKSEPWLPHHPHTRSVAVVPGEICEYAIRIFSMSNVFRKGHCVELEIKSIEDPNDEILGVMPPDSFHLNSGRATTHKIYRDKSHQSHLLLPFIPKESESQINFIEKSW